MAIGASKETQSWSGDSLVTRLAGSERPSHHAFVVFRGFPGSAPPAEAEKYAFLAGRTTLGQALHRATGADIYTFQYPGLCGSRGKFTFMGAVEGALAFVRGLAAGPHEKIHLAGYSWGGLVAWNAREALGAKRGLLALVSALSDLGDDGRIRALLPWYIENYPNIFGEDRQAALETSAADLARVRDRCNPLTLASRAVPAAAGLLLVHGSSDEEVPVEQSRALHKAAGGRLAEWPDDHIYSKSWDRMLGELAVFALNGR